MYYKQVKFMKNVDYEYLCSVIGSLASIPVRTYKNGDLIVYKSVVKFPKDPIIPYEKDILSINRHIGYYITPHFNYYGVVSCPPYKIVMGPTMQTQYKEQDMRELAFLCAVDKEDTNTFISGMKRIAPFPLISIIKILTTLNYMLNDEKIDLTDISISDSRDGLQQSVQNQMDVNDNVDDNSGVKPQNNSFLLEEKLCDLVQRGATEE